MKNINYKAILCIGLLSLNLLFSCTSTKQAMNPREEMIIDMPGNAKKMHKKNWTWSQRCVYALAASAGIGGLGGYLYSNTGISSPSNITGSSDTNFTPENLNAHNGPQAEMLSDDMPNMTAMSNMSKMINDDQLVEKIIDVVCHKPLSDLIVLMEKIPKTESFLKTRDRDGKTALIYAIMKGKENMVRFLVNKMNPKDLNEADKDGKTALIYAIMKGKENMVRFLVNKMNPKDLNEADKDGKTALIYAIACFQYDICNLLINKMDPKDLNKADKDGKTALIHAIEKNCEEYMIKLLIDRMDEKDLNKADKGGKTALMYQILSYKKGDILKLLIDKMNEEGLNKADNSGETALMYAVIYDKIYAANLKPKS